MKRRTTYLLVVAFAAITSLYAGACIFRSTFIKEVHWKGGKLLSTGSIQESKKRGCFVEELNIRPETLAIADTSIRFNRAWLEKQHDLSFVVVLIPGVIEYPVFTMQDGYNINFTLADSIIPDHFMPWMFVIEGRGRAFGVHSTKRGRTSIGYFSDSIESDRWNFINVFLTSNWNLTNAMRLTITKKAQQSVGT